MIQRTLGHQITVLSLLVILCLGAGGIGAWATTSEIQTWYRTIDKPSWNPPDAVFGPVWTVLYLLMATAAWLVWRSGELSATRIALGWFAVQLVLNTLWSFLFFGMHQPGWAFAELLLLWLVIAATAAQFFSHSRPAGWLMMPYLAWVTFAGALNFAIWQLNR
jgi:tryptophan-rich sensory protein